MSDKLTYPTVMINFKTYDQAPGPFLHRRASAHSIQRIERTKKRVNK